MVMVSLALANGFAPKHAHASGGHVAIAQHSHGGHDHDHAHHHHPGAPDDHATATVADDPDGGSDEQQGVPIVNCCVASCAAIALIFSTIELPTESATGTLVPSTSDSMVLAGRISDDPPPR